MVTTYIARTRALPVFLGKCGNCIRPVRAEDDTETRDHVSRPCPDCRQPVKVERLYGTVSEMQCDIRCEGAGGPSCDCACGGINHGGAWSKPGHMLASELAVYRAAVERKEAERRKRRKAEAGRRRSAFDRWRKDHEPVVSELLGTDWYECDYPNGFLADLALQLRRLDILSDRQVDAAARVLAKRREAAAAARERDAARQARQATATDVPTGRHTVTGTVEAVYTVETNFSYHGEVKTCIVVDTGSYRVRGTCPRSLIWLPESMSTPDHRTIARGDRVTFSAELKPDGKEAGSGYFSRPTKPAFA